MPVTGTAPLVGICENDHLVALNQVDDLVGKTLKSNGANERMLRYTAVSRCGFWPFTDVTDALCEAVSQTVAESRFLVFIPKNRIEELRTSTGVFTPAQSQLADQRHLSRRLTTIARAISRVSCPLTS